LPDPPLEFAMTMVGIRIPLSDKRIDHSMLTAREQIARCLLSADSLLYVDCSLTVCKTFSSR
jgi:hypothetical protein